MQLPRLCERPNNEDGDVSVGVYGYWRSPQTIKKRDTVKELISSGASVHCTSYSGTDGGDSSGEGDPQTIKKRDTVKELISSGASVHCTSYSGTDGGEWKLKW